MPRREPRPATRGATRPPPPAANARDADGPGAQYHYLGPLLERGDGPRDENRGRTASPPASSQSIRLPIFGSSSDEYELPHGQYHGTGDDREADATDAESEWQTEVSGLTSAMPLDFDAIASRPFWPRFQRAGSSLADNSSLGGFTPAPSANGPLAPPLSSSSSVRSYVHPRGRPAGQPLANVPRLLAAETAAPPSVADDDDDLWTETDAGAGVESFGGSVWGGRLQYQQQQHLCAPRTPGMSADGGSSVSSGLPLDMASRLSPYEPSITQLVPSPRGTDNLGAGEEDGGSWFEDDDVPSHGPQQPQQRPQPQQQRRAPPPSMPLRLHSSSFSPAATAGTASARQLQLPAAPAPAVLRVLRMGWSEFEVADDDALYGWSNVGVTSLPPPATARGTAPRRQRTRGKRQRWYGCFRARLARPLAAGVRAVLLRLYSCPCPTQMGIVVLGALALIIIVVIAELAGPRVG